MKPLLITILAAGKSVRMKSKIPKVLHPILGVPMLEYVFLAVKDIECSELIVVAGAHFEKVYEYVKSKAKVVKQEPQCGTGHAVLCVKQNFADFNGNIMVLYGDMPEIDAATLQRFLDFHYNSGNDLSILTTMLDEPYGYGRIIRDEEGRVLKIVEEKDCSVFEQKIKEINTGVYLFDSLKLFEVLEKLKPDNAQHEIYLTDTVYVFKAKSYKVGAYCDRDSWKFKGINNRWQLIEVEKRKRLAKLKELAENGVTVISPETTFIEKNVTIGKDTVIYPFCVITGETQIEEDCSIGPNTRLSNAKLGRNVNILYSVVFDSIILDNTNIGPFAHIRQGTVIKENVRVGNFVEIKKSTLENNVKAAHLTYLGDAEIGENSNIGAGTITCNYDGKNKNPTTIGKSAFIGSNTALVAPVTVGEGAYIGAGSTITKDVPPYSLAIGRARQVVKQDWSKRKGKQNDSRT